MKNHFFNDLIAPEKKNQEWVRGKALQIMNVAQSSSHLKQRDYICFKYYNEEFADDESFDYLRKYDSYVMPAKIRWVPLVRPRLQRLISELSLVPFKYDVLLADSESLLRKHDRIINAVLDEMELQIRNNAQQITTLIGDINNKKAQLQQALQQKNMPPEKMQELRMVVAQKEQEYSETLQGLNYHQGINSERLNAVEKSQKYDFKEMEEVAMKKIIKANNQRYNLHAETVKAFTNKLVTGQQLYYVNYREGEKDPIFKADNIMQVFWDNNSDNEWIQHGRWVARKEYYSREQIYDLWGDQMNSEDIRELINLPSSQYESPNALMATPNGAIDTGYFGSKSKTQGVPVWFVYYRSPRKVRFKKSPNKHLPERPFTHVMKDEEKVRTQKGEKEIVRYPDDMYQATIINGKIIVDDGLSPFQVRSQDNPGRVELPIIGKSFNETDKVPYSIIWSTKDLQIQYNLVNYHKELMLALGGVRGIVMDLSQKPTAMSKAEWFYDFKRGVAWIQSKDKNGRSAQFNQFKTFDNSVSPAIQYLDNIMENIRTIVGDVTGVTRQRMGDVVDSDQVGTSNMALQQSSMTTQILYYEHEEVTEKALTRYANIGKNSAWKEGRIDHFINTDTKQQEIIRIPKQIGEGKDFLISMGNLSKEYKNLQEIKQLAFSSGAAKHMTMSQISKMYRIEDIIELEKTLEEFEEKAAELAQQANISEEEAKAEMAMQKIKFEKEYDLKIQQQANNMKEYQLKLKEKELEIKKTEIIASIEQKQLEMQVNANLKVAKIESESEVEQAYLQEKSRANQAMEGLNKLKLKLEAIQTEIQAVNDEEKRVSNEKVKFSSNKQGGSKEHINDN